MKAHAPAELRIPESRLITLGGSAYSIQPIANQLSMPGHHATDYAKAIHRLRAELWQEMPWAIASVPDADERASLIAEVANEDKHTVYEQTGERIAKRGRYGLMIGAFDTAVPVPGSPDSLVGYVEASLVVSGATALHRYIKRTSRLDKVYPGLGGGPEIAVSITDKNKRNRLHDALFAVALSAFDSNDIALKYRNTLDYYSVEADSETNDWLAAQGAVRVIGKDTGKTYVGSKLVRMQFSDLKAIKADT